MIYATTMDINDVAVNPFTEPQSVHTCSELALKWSDIEDACSLTTPSKVKTGKLSSLPIERRATDRMICFIRETTDLIDGVSSPLTGQ